jgi:hypothetical protein
MMEVDNIGSLYHTVSNSDETSASKGQNKIFPTAVAFGNHDSVKPVDLESVFCI